MDIVKYIASLRRQSASITEQRNAITIRGMRMHSRWGNEPQVDTTDAWLKELDRRKAELDSIANGLERGQPV